LGACLISPELPLSIQAHVAVSEAFAALEHFKLGHGRIKPVYLFGEPDRFFAVATDEMVGALDWLGAGNGRREVAARSDQQKFKVVEAPVTGSGLFAGIDFLPAPEALVRVSI
jgi:hypothetical protein